MMPRPPQRARLYARFSPRPGAEECESVKSQLAELRQAAERLHLEAYEYWDEDISGRDRSGAIDGSEALEIGKRAGLIRLLDELRRGDLVLVRDISRLARDVFVEEYIIRRIGKAGATLQCLRETFRTDPDGVMMRQILASFRQREATIVAALTKAKMLAHQSAGRIMSAKLPLGWKVDPGSEPSRKSLQRHAEGKGPLRPGRMIECPKEQAIKRRIIELFEGGFEPELIAKTFEAEHVKFRGRTRWHAKTIQAVLRREGLWPRLNGDH